MLKNVKQKDFMGLKFMDGTTETFTWEDIQINQKKHQEKLIKMQLIRLLLRKPFFGLQKGS